MDVLRSNPMKKDGGVEALERKLASLVAVKQGVGRSGDLVNALAHNREGEKKKKKKERKK